MSASPATDHPERSLLESYFNSTISPDDWQRLAEHLAACDDCRRQFDELRAENEVDPDEGQVLSAREIQLAVKLALERHASVSVKVAPPEPLADRRAALLGAGALAVAAAAALVVALPKWKSVNDGGFTARGQNDEVGAEVLCFAPGNTSTAQTLTENGRCPAGSLLKLKARSLEAKRAEVGAVVLRADDGVVASFQGTLQAGTATTLKGYAELPAGETFKVVFVFTETRLAEGALRSMAVDGPDAGARRVIVVEAVSP